MDGFGGEKSIEILITVIGLLLIIRVTPDYSQSLYKLFV